MFGGLILLRADPPGGSQQTQITVFNPEKFGNMQIPNFGICMHAVSTGECSHTHTHTLSGCLLPVTCSCWLRFVAVAMAAVTHVAVVVSGCFC